MSEKINDLTEKGKINDLMWSVLDYCYCDDNCKDYLERLEFDEDVSNHIWVRHLELAKLLGCECLEYWLEATRSKAEDAGFLTEEQMEKIKV